jgi:hypothetical protein
MVTAKSPHSLQKSRPPEQLHLPERDRERFIKFGKERALEGAGPVTVGIDLGHIKTILSHAAAVHGVVVSTEPIDLARSALAISNPESPQQLSVGP